MKRFSYVPFAVVLFVALVLFGTGAPAQAQTCAACNLAHERCTANCSGLENSARIKGCLIGCDNAAVSCSCDEEVTLRSEDVVANLNWLSPAFEEAAACHSTTPCGTEYGSCASWTTYFDCGDPFCGFGARCGDDCSEFGPCPGPALKQSQERYRVCLNQFGQACTEYQRLQKVLSCGC